ncbi:MAG TPA: aldo/keto reductase [Caulobacteraceae bacterium]|nr:aldo/keto reductase [Caulobacteraceae bacterium]
MKTRPLGPFSVSSVALGCMSLSHGYGGRPTRADAEALLNKALDVGYTLLDTATVYGSGANESLIGETLKARRSEFTLASKCGLYIADGKRVIDGRPQAVREALDASLKRLQTDVIDLYYLHRLDPNTPIEDSVGELALAVQAGKIRGIGLSEMSAATLRRAHAVHPIMAMQTEYSLWTRNPEIAVLDACRDLGVAFVAFSPVARGFLSATPPQALEPGDIRAGMPRFLGETYAANLKLLEPLSALASEAGCSVAQLAIAWVLAQGEHIIALPGTAKIAHMMENAGAAALNLDPSVLARAGEIINRNTVHGPRYNAANQMDIDTEEFAA